jgi:hypothetical protein
MVIIPDIVFLIIGLACLMTLLSIRKELRKITHSKRKRYSEWSLEDQMKLRVKYLHHCKRLEDHLNRLRPKIPGTTSSGLTA